MEGGDGDAGGQAGGQAGGTHLIRCHGPSGEL